MEPPSSAPLPRPARRITPHDFYCSYLPALWRAFTHGLAWPDWGFAASVVLDNGRTETYGLTLSGGALQAAEGPAADTLVTFRSSRAAWRLAVRDILPRVLRFADGEAPRIHSDLAAFAAGGFHRIDPETFRSMPGIVQLHYVDDAGDSAEVAIEIGSGRGPRAQIHATDADLWAALRARGSLTPLLRSRVQLDGDVGYVLQLARALDRATGTDRGA